MLDNQVINAELGLTEGVFRLNRIDDLKVVIYRLFSQATKSIDLFTVNLDPRLLNDRSIENALSRLARSSRYSRIRLLIHDPLSLQGIEHRLINLSQTLSSYVTIKVLAKEFTHLPYVFYLVDNHGYLYRSHHAEYESQVSFNNANQVREWRRQFEDMWEQSRIASEFRALSL